VTETDDRPIGELLAEQVAELATRAPRPEPPAAPRPVPPDVQNARRDLSWSHVIPSRFLWARCEHFDGVTAGSPTGPIDVGVALRAWGEAPGGRNLVLTGATGTGKTHAAIAAARAAFDAGAHVRFTPVVELLDALRPGSTGGDGVLDELFGIDVLVLDDLGAERPTDWTLERLYALVNRRWMEERPTIATSNLDVPKPLAAAVGERTYSRLVGSSAVVLQLGGDDRRRKR
jgi:DNA replication protein DnaC